MADEATMAELKSYRLGTNKDGEFSLFEADVYTSPDKIRTLLVTYCGLGVRKLPRMQVVDLEQKLMLHYIKLSEAFFRGYCEYRMNACSIAIHVCL